MQVKDRNLLKTKNLHEVFAETLYHIIFAETLYQIIFAETL